MSERAAAKGAVAGGALMAAGGIALGVVMFLNWYDDPLTGEKLDAWSGLRRSDVVIFVLAVIGVLVGGAAAFPRPGADPTQLRSLGLVGAAAGALAALVIVLRMASPPGEADLELGIVLALLAALVVAAGGALAALAAPR